MGEEPGAGRAAGASPKTSGLAIASLVLGIVGIPLAAFLLFGVLGLIFGIVALVKISGSKGRLGGEGFAIAGTCVSAVSLCFFLLTLGLVLPAVAAGRERARRAKCASNLKQISYGVQLHAIDYNEQFPESLEVLFKKDYLKDRRVFRCPSRRVPEDGGCDYEYVKGVHAMHPPYCVVAYDKEGNHPDGRNVLFVGVKVEWMTEGALREAMEKTRQFLRSAAPAR